MGEVHDSIERRDHVVITTLARRSLLAQDRRRVVGQAREEQHQPPLQGVLDLGRRAIRVDLDAIAPKEIAFRPPNADAYWS